VRAQPTQNRALLDEIEDLFNANGEASMLPRVPGPQKGWINGIPIPCFWLTNSLHARDNAYIRRFDIVIKLDNPPRKPAQKDNPKRQPQQAWRQPDRQADPSRAGYAGDHYQGDRCSQHAE
jgi:hypothetical protein